MFHGAFPVPPPFNHLASPVWWASPSMSHVLAWVCIEACVQSLHVAGFIGMYACACAPPNPGPLWANVTHCGDKMWCVTWETHRHKGQTVHLANTHILGTQTHGLHKWLVMDGCFRKTAGKEWRMWESGKTVRNVYFCLLPIGTTTLTP